MISTVLAAHPILVRVLFVIGVLACAALGAVLHRAGKTRALLVLAAAALVAAFALTFSPAHNLSEGFCTVQFSVPFAGVETLANIALLLPATLFTALAVERPVLVFAAASALSASVELVQGLLPALGRACDTNDWYMNTIGAAVGALIAAIVIVARARRTSDADRRLSATREH